jgi:hypothetical protein
VIAQSAGRPDYDVSARGKLALFAARIHAADAGDEAPIRVLIKPCEFAMDLQGEFARWRDDQGKRCCRPLKPLDSAQKILCNRQPISDGLARAGLGRTEKIAVDSFVRKRDDLNRGRPIVAALGSRASAVREEADGRTAPPGRSLLANDRSGLKPFDHSLERLR